MTRHLITAIALAVPGFLCVTLSAQAAPRTKAAPSTKAQVPAQRQIISVANVQDGYRLLYPSKGKMLTAINYAEAVVPPEAVGSEDKLGVVTVSPAVPVSAVWTSQSELTLVLKGDLDPEAVYSIQARPGVKNAQGRELGTFHTLLFAKQLNDYFGSSERFLCCPTSDAETAAKFLARAVLRSSIIGPDGKTEKVTDRPAGARPATVGDAVAHWNDYLESGDYKEDIEAFKALPQDEVLPGYWYFEMPVPAANERLQLVLPGYGNLDTSAGKRLDSVIRTATLPSLGITLERVHTGLGRYDILVHMDQPVAPEEVERALMQGTWEIRQEGDSKTAPLATMQVENGVLKATVNGKPVTMSYDAEATAKLQKKVPTAAGEKTACPTAVLHMDTGGECFQLAAVVKLASVHGASADNLKDSCFVSPPHPTINTDVLTSGKLSKGSKTIHCLVQSMEKATAHIYRIDAHGEAPAKVLAAFRELYTPAKVLELGGYSDEADEARKHPTVFPVQLLPGVAESREVDIPCDSEPHDIKLGELFPQAPESSMYFMEVNGTLVPDLGKPGAKYANQGIIQVTDLGLMWKESRDKIFAYAYRLSDAKALEHGTLLLQDKNGETIATMDVQNGIAEGTLLKGTCFLQLVSGDDSYTVALQDAKSKNETTQLTGDFWVSDVERGMPRTETFLFTDRSLYRPGETAHIKGYVRTIAGDKVTIPEITSITATVEGDKTPIKVDMQPDGSFAVDVQPTTIGSYVDVRFNMVQAGDGNGTSPDMAAAKAMGADMKEVQYILNGSRTATISLNVQEFHRDEFELKQALTVDSGAQWVEINTNAAGFNGAPVANGKVEWELQQQPANLYPDAFPSFQFSDSDTLGDRIDHDDDAALTGFASKMDEKGHGSHRFDLAATSGRRQITVGSTVTNANGRSVRFAERRIIDSSSVYGGIRVANRLVEKGQNVEIALVAVDKEGNALTAAPVNAKVKVERQSFRSYRFGLGSTSAARNVPRVQTVAEQDVQLAGTPANISIPVANPGVHLVTLEGTDAQGRTFKATHDFYVVGEHELDDDIPWDFRDGEYIGLVGDKDVYKPGETAHLLVQSPVDAEALITLEREGVVRHFKQHISAAHPVVDIPLTEADAPGLAVGLFLVQDASARKDGRGLPIIKTAEIPLRVDPVGKRLAVELDKPASPQLPGATARVSGVVKDAQGNPLANAGVTLYAEDEGTLQIRGYKLPDPARHFYTDTARCHSLRTYSSLFQIRGEVFQTSMLGNKGVFIGGGDDEGDMEVSPTVRENFNPCAVWLANIKTDAQGRFSAEYTNPDTLTRYRVMAVAAAGADKFGSGQTSYEVNKAVMLEPAAPAAAAAGDELYIPVTVSMNPDQLPEEYRNKPITWNISLNAENAAGPGGPLYVTLTGNTPVTTYVPVRFPEVGETTLTWTATPQDEALRDKTDAVRDHFTVVPPTPFLREAVYEAVEAGESLKPADLVSLDFRSDSHVSLDFSANPLIGATQGMDMLVHYPYGCSEQLASGMLPWILQDELAPCVGMKYPQGKTRATVIAESVKKLSERFTSGMGFSYWGSGDVTPFSPHVALALLLAQDKGISLPYNISTANLVKMLVNATANKDEPSSAVYAAYVLARAGKLTPELLAQAEKQLPKNADARLAWGLALAARVSGNPRADALCKAAAKAQEKREWSYLPAVRTLRMLEQIAREPKSARTTAAVREYVAYDAQHFNSTYGNAWLMIVLHEFIAQSDIQNVRAVVNGNELALQKMWHKDTTVGTQDAFACTEGTAYACGLAEGYQNKDQEPRMVDEGFKVTRRYERYAGNNTWVPTAQFTVGDVVRVTLECTPTRDTGRYTVLEDRLPAVFEAVNPELTSQDVPAELRSNPSIGWSFTSWVDNKVYGKDRVAFFTSHGGTMKCSYIARVVKFGKVTAPAAKAEMMYTPQNYGLSIPHVITATAPEVEIPSAPAAKADK